jgi:hypothetical protein
LQFQFLLMELVFLYFFIGFLGSGSRFAPSPRLAGFDWAHSLGPQRIRDMCARAICG